jgi:TPR repeat protein
MSLLPREAAAHKLIREEAKLQTSIGHSIYWFSQLEFTMKSRLADALELPEDLFNIITGPYDFAMLCTVTEKAVTRTAAAGDHAKIKKYFNACRKVNQEARVIVAHGSWTFEGARHVSRNTLTAKHYFAKAADLDKQATETKRLMAVLYTGAL